MSVSESHSVSDFFSKGGIRKFARKTQNFVERNSVKTLASAVLLSAFSSTLQASTPSGDLDKTVSAYAITEKGDTLCDYKAAPKDSVSFARLQKLVNNATKSKTGRSILKSISKQGTALSIDSVGPSAVGFYSLDENRVVLNEKCSDAALQSCLIHEGKHSVQRFALKRPPSYQCDLMSQVMLTRAMEADAVATQTKFSYELMQAGDSAAWYDLQSRKPGITTFFEVYAEEQGIDSKEAMKVAMLKWYDNIPYSSGYDEMMIGYRDKVSKKVSPAKLKGLFSQTVDADSVITRICSLDGVSYAGTDGSLLKTPRTLSMSQKNYEAAKALSEYQMKKSGVSDNSADSFYTLTDKEKPTNITYAQANLSASGKLMPTPKLEKISLQKTVRNVGKPTVAPIRVANLGGR